MRSCLLFQYFFLNSIPYKHSLFSVTSSPCPFVSHPDRKGLLVLLQTTSSVLPPEVNLKNPRQAKIFMRPNWSYFSFKKKGKEALRAFSPSCQSHPANLKHSSFLQDNLQVCFWEESSCYNTVSWFVPCRPHSTDPFSFLETTICSCSYLWTRYTEGSEEW